jgi:hypothetical protein
MAGLLIFTGVVALASGLFAWFDPNGERARLASARAELKRAGFTFKRGSAEEARALRIVLDGDSLEAI